MHQEDGRGSRVAWHALFYTRYQHEKLVQEILIEKGFETFLLLHEAPIKWSGYRSQGAARPETTRPYAVAGIRAPLPRNTPETLSNSDLLLSL